MILPAQIIRRIKPIMPFHERTVVNGMSFGLSSNGYDVRIAEDHTLFPGAFQLGSTLEHFDMPNDLVGIVHDKSTWARRGLAVQNTVIEAGWRGYLTIELSHHGQEVITVMAGDPIAQILFHGLVAATEQPYAGKYQDQEAGPQKARKES